jgi:hypothetical protein
MKGQLARKIHSKIKKDAYHILIPQVISFFHIYQFWYRHEKNRSIMKSKYDLRPFFAVKIAESL